MIVCSAPGGDKGVLILGLSHENLAQLREGKSIRVTRESHGLIIPSDLAVVLFAAATEEDMYRALVERGLISAVTVTERK